MLYTFAKRATPSCRAFVPFDHRLALSKALPFQRHANRNASHVLKMETAEGHSPGSGIPDFTDSRTAYESKKTMELLRGAACFRLCKIPFIVENAEDMLNMAYRFPGKTVTNSVLRASLYGQFCAGKDREDIEPALTQLQELGVGCILDYAAESDDTAPESSEPALSPQHPVARQYDYESESQCDKNLKSFQKCILDAASLSSKDSFAAAKVTALGNPKLLARMSRAIVESELLFQKFDTNLDGFISREDFAVGCDLFFDNNEDFNLKDMYDEFDPEGTGKIDYITWSLKLKPFDLHKVAKSCKEVGPFGLAAPTEEEIELMEAMYQRGHALAETAAKAGTRLLIDAEQAKFQPAIDSLVLDLQQSFNSVESSDKPVVYNTYQCYLRDAPERLKRDVNRAERLNYHFGAKLVRGAYMESERALAEALSLPSPIHDSIEETHACYNNSVDFLLKQSLVSDNKVEVMCATHNQESMEKAIEAMREYQIDASSSTISFAQLYGMSDHLSLSLGKCGYRVFKYVPYGEVEEVIPYLLRRARENSAVVGGASAELAMITSEIGRRLRPW